MNNSNQTNNKMTTTFLFHEKSKNEKGQRRSIAGKIENNELKIGVSICGPKDQFNRKLGRKIAEGRANKSPFKVITLSSDEDAREVFYSSLKAL